MLGAIDDKLYLYALRLFSDAGITGVNDPIFFNHSPKQAIYFDSDGEQYITGEQRSLLDDFCNVSLLFYLDDTVFEKRTLKRIAFFSLDLLCKKQYRSTLAYDVHMLLDLVYSADASIVLCRHENKIMLTFAGFGQACILSDWYEEEVDDDSIIEKIHVVNERLSTAYGFFLDIVYNIARQYYIYPISKEQAIYESLPLNAFDPNRERPSAYEIQEAIDTYLNTYINAYGDDYVEPGGKVISNKEISQELDALLLSIDNEEDAADESEFLEDSDYMGDTMASDDEENEIKNLDPELFKDPIKMVKWLEKHTK